MKGISPIITLKIEVNKFSKNKPSGGKRMKPSVENCMQWVERDKKVIAPCSHLSYFPLVVAEAKQEMCIRDRCVKPCPQHGVPVDKALDVVPLRTGDPLGDLPEGIVVMQLRHRRGTEPVSYTHLDVYKRQCVPRRSR